jgi:hypothetical protein
VQPRRGFDNLTEVRDQRQKRADDRLRPRYKGGRANVPPLSESYRVISAITIRLGALTIMILSASLTYL